MGPPAAEVSQSVKLAGWNFAGCSLEAFQGSVLSETFGSLPQLIALQELPRAKPGWTWREEGKIGFWSFQHVDAWRGTGIAFHVEHWVVLRKLHSSCGTWFRVRHTGTMAEMWVGSMYIAPHEPMVAHQTLVREHLERLPATTHPVLSFGDANAAIKWKGCPPVPLGEGGKGTMFVDVGMEFGYTLVPPGEEQRDQPTSRPRNKGVRGNQIDFCLAKNARTQHMRIVTDSCYAVGTDHDAITVEVDVAVRVVHRRRLRAGCRVLKGSLPPTSYVDHQTLKDLAASNTCPPSTKAYKDSPATKTLFSMARHSRSSQDWIRALRSRQADRSHWKEQLVAASQGDWRSFRSFKPKVGGWQTHFAEAVAPADPHKIVHDHYSQVFSGGEVPDVDSLPPPPASPDFTEDELLASLGKGKRGKSVGVDGVSLELLQGLCQQSEGRRALLHWFNRLLHGETMPEDWLMSLMVLLPKKDQPQEPKDTRPISMGSATEKLFSRMVLERCKHTLGNGAAWQCSGPHKQSTDYLYVAHRLFETEREWAKGLAVVKLDIARAFDSVSRSKLFERLRARLGWTEECRVWGRLLSGTGCQLQSPWGQSVFSTTRGIRQGAVESLLLFCCVMQWVFESVMSAHSWRLFPSSYPDMQTSQSAYMDDIYLWDGSSSSLQLKLEQLQPALLEWGLRLNIDKCALYLSPKHCGPNGIVLEGKKLSAQSHMHIMGIAFKVGANVTELLSPIWEKGKRKFWSLKHLLCSSAPLKDRLRLFQKVVGGAMLWCVCAFSPESQALETLNRIMYQLVIYMLRLKKGKFEEWVDFRKRGVRHARQVVSLHLKDRWSTQWLARYWNYAGHVARGLLNTPAPSSAILCYHRSVHWWERQQEDPLGMRHSNRFFSKLYPLERSLDTAAGGEWRFVAMDRREWRSKLPNWTERMDVPWTSGSQDALMMY